MLTTLLRGFGSMDGSVSAIAELFPAENAPRAARTRPEPETSRRSRANVWAGHLEIGCGQKRLEVAIWQDLAGVSGHRDAHEGVWSMTSRYWRITLVLRTIGARRGRAARGRPLGG